MSAPAINNQGGFGRWALVEIDDPWDAQNLIRAFLSSHVPGTQYLVRGTLY